MIFISYRRTDTRHLAIRIHEKLAGKFGKSSVFFDTQSIPYGDDFPVAIRKSLNACKVFLPIIGKQWLKATNDDNQERLHLPNDYVRIEIATAIALKLDIIPVLDDGVSMPKKEALPDDLRDLTFKNAITIQSNDDIDRLIQAIQQKLPIAPDPQKTDKKRFHPLPGLLIVILLLISMLAGWYYMIVSPKMSSLLDNGRLFINTGLYSQAEQYYESAKKQNPFSNEAEKGLQLTALYHKSHSEKLPRNEALQSIKDFQKHYPNSAHAYILLGDMYVNTDTAKAMAYYKQAQSLDSQIPEINFSMGYIFAAHLKEYLRASIEYEQAITLLKQASPDMYSIRYLTNLASVYAKLDKTEKSIDLYQKAIACEKDALATYIRLIDLLRLSGEKDVAMRYSQSLSNLISDSNPFLKPINCQPWSFEGFDAHQQLISIQIQNNDEKVYYCLLTICLTNYVCGNKAAIEPLLKRADKIKSIDKQTMLSLIYSDMIRLHNKQIISQQSLTDFMRNVTANGIPTN
jgi:tetratricopeptide (TPR) repeat protein